MMDKLIHAAQSFHNSQLVNIGSHYVFYSTLVLNLLAFSERILFVFETKIKTWFPQSPIPAKLFRVEYWLEFLTDLVEALGQLNFKDGIRPTRFNKRKNDVTAQANGSSITPQQNSAAPGR